VARAAKAAARIRVLPHRSVVIDGRAVGAGQEADVSAADAKTLITDGYAEDAKQPKRKAVARRKPARPAKRKPLTPQAVDRDEEERGG
jgi:hypothetical protein